MAEEKAVHLVEPKAVRKASQLVVLMAALMDVHLAAATALQKAVSMAAWTVRQTAVLRAVC